MARSGRSTRILLSGYEDYYLLLRGACMSGVGTSFHFVIQVMDQLELDMIGKNSPMWQDKASQKIGGGPFRV